MRKFKEIQFESQSNGEKKVEFKDEKLCITYNKGVSTTEEIVALINAYPSLLQQLQAISLSPNNLILSSV